MAKGIGSMDVRKLQLTGGVTYTLSLPKFWVETNKLESSDGIQVDWRPSGALRLTPVKDVNEMRRRSIVIQEDIPDAAIFDHLVGSYLSGANQIDFMERQVSSLLDSYKVAEALNLGRREAVEFANLSRSLERMADHANQLSELIISTEKIPNMNPDDAPLSLIPIRQEAMRSLMLNLRTDDAEKIEIARSNLKQSKNELLDYEEKLWSQKESPSRILFKFKFSESIRRICSYSRDFGEIILNMMAHSNVIEDN